jgi:hypothetical protein
VENILDIINTLSNKSNTESKQNPIPKEITDQYPYGQFPIQYTRSGQEQIRKQSENRFSYEKNEPEKTQNSNLDIKSILPIIQILSGQKKQPKDLLKVVSKIIFKDNPEMEKLFNLLPTPKSQEIKSSETFPNTNKVSINNLKRIN